MIDVDLGSGAGVGAAVAAVAWLVIQQVAKPILSLWASYAIWPESAKTALWSGVITIAAGTMMCSIVSIKEKQQPVHRNVERKHTNATWTSW